MPGKACRLVCRQRWQGVLDDIVDEAIKYFGVRVFVSREASQYVFVRSGCALCIPLYNHENRTMTIKRRDLHHQGIQICEKFFILLQSL